MDSTIPLLPKSEIKFVAVQLGLCRTGSEIPMAVFLATRLVLKQMGPVTRKMYSGFPTKSDTGPAVQLEQMFRGLKLRM